MKIAQVPRRFVQSAWGGTETVVLETTKRMRAHGHDAFVLCPNALADAPQENIAGVPVQRVPYFYPYAGLSAPARAEFDRAGGNMFSFALLRELQRTPDLDLIHLHTGKRVGGIGRYVARRRHIPYVVSLHGGVFDVSQAPASRWTRPSRAAIEWGKVLGWWVGSRRVLLDADAVICVGKRERDLAERALPNQRVEYLPNGVDIDRFAVGDGAAFRRRHAIPVSARVVLTVGRVDPQKNQLAAIDALQRLRASGLDAHLALIGPVTDEAYARQVRRAITDRGLSAHVTLLPGVAPESRELVDAYHAADVFLLPSVHEPFGIVVLEAWAAGTPVVAANVGGIPGFVEDGVTAQLVQPQDARGTVTALERLLGDAAVASALRDRAGALVRHAYSWDVVTARLLALYQDIVARRRAAPRRAA